MKAPLVTEYELELGKTGPIGRGRRGRIVALIREDAERHAPVFFAVTERRARADHDAIAKFQATAFDGLVLDRGTERGVEAGAFFAVRGALRYPHARADAAVMRDAARPARPLAAALPAVELRFELVRRVPCHGVRR